MSEDPTIHPSDIFNTSSTVSCLTPVLAKTGVFGSTAITHSKSESDAASPVICPLTRIPSGIEENSTLLARSESFL